MKVGEIIKSERLKNGLSQRELGEKVEMSQQMIAQYENGKRKPKFENLKKIAIALNVQIDVFLSEDTNELIENIYDLYNDNNIKKIEETPEEHALKTSLNFNFISLNLEGKQKVVDYSEDLVNSKKYTKKEN